MSFRTKLKYIRNFRHETLESLGVKVGFPQAQANSRIAQYESGYKKPRQDVVYDLAKALDVSPIYLQEPDPEYILGVLQFLFEMERIYGLELDYDLEKGDVILKFNKHNEKNNHLVGFLLEWLIVKHETEDGQHTEEEYEEWKLQYPHTKEGIGATKEGKEWLLQLATKDTKKRINEDQESADFIGGLFSAIEKYNDEALKTYYKNKNDEILKDESEKKNDD